MSAARSNAAPTPDGTARNPIEPERRAAVEGLAHRIFGRAPRRVAFPGGRSRSAFVADMGDSIVVMAERNDERDAQLEATVLKGLAGSSRTPAFVARHGKWLVQECVDGKRLPLELDAAGQAGREVLLRDALDGLIAIREAAAASGLVHRVPKLGVRDGWFAERITEAHDAAEKLGIAPPAIDVAALSKVLDVRHRDFVKWDARSGNALVRPDGTTIWFDWEDCGRHDTMDDLVCLLADEWTPLEPALEAKLVADYLPRFAGRRTVDRAARDFAVMAMVQIGFRLRLAVGYWARKERWWDRDKCLAGDKVGVTANEVGTLVARGRRLAAPHAETQGYLPFLDAVEARLQLAADRAT